MTPGSSAAIFPIIALFIVTLGTPSFAQFENIPADGSLNLQGQVRDRGNSYLYASYSLTGGILSKSSIRLLGAIFRQSGGTNIVHGDLELVYGWHRTSYILTGGCLITSNTVVGLTYQGGFVHNGGLHIVRNSLTLSRASGYYHWDYQFRAGSLRVKDIIIGPSARFSHTGGKLTHRGVLALLGGNWHSAQGAHQLGRLQLLASTTNSSLLLPHKIRSTIRFAHSAAMPWDTDAQLIVHNWRGAAFRDPGWHRIYFGRNSSGLTPQQLTQIRFRNPHGAAPGDYAVRLRANGELVPIK